MGKIVRFLKLFVTMFVLIFVANILLYLIWDVMVKGREFEIDKILSFSTNFGFSIGWSIFNVKRYEKCRRFLGYIREKDNLLERSKKVLLKMGWTLVDEKDNLFIYKSSFLRTIWIESIIIQLDEKDISIIGPECYVDKVIDKTIV